MAKSRFPKTLAIAALGLGLAGAGAYYFLGKQADKAPEISSVPVGLGEITQSVTASGALEPVTSIDVSSQVSGLIQEVLVDYNTPVKKGDVLARLDPATYEQRLKQADADLASTKANVQLVTLNTRRTIELHAKGLATEAEKDQAEAQLLQAKATLITRTASVEDARVNLSRCTIYAPIDGIVMQRNTEPGKTVAASLNAPTLFIIANDLSKMQIVADVAEADVGNIDVGQKVSFRVDAFPARDFRGKVAQIRNYPKTTSNVVTYQTVIEVSNDDLKLKPGMTANVTITVAEHRNVLRVANSALRARVPESMLAPKPTEPGKPATSEAAKEVSPEERRKIMGEIFQEVGFSREGGQRPTPDQIAKIQELAKARGIEFDPSRFGNRRNGQGGPGSGQGNGGEVATSRTVYVLKSNAGTKPVIESVSVKAGISDGMYTEILSGVKEGDALITLVTINGVPVTTSSTQQQGANNPFAPRMGGPRR